AAPEPSPGGRTGRRESQVLIGTMRVPDCDGINDSCTGAFSASSLTMRCRSASISDTAAPWPCVSAVSGASFRAPGFASALIGGTVFMLCLMEDRSDFRLEVARSRALALGDRHRARAR